MYQRLAIVCLLFLSSPAVAWWHCGWDNRFTASVSAPPGGALTEYQVRLDLNAGNVPPQFDWSLQGDDIRIVADDDLTELAFAIEQWDVSGQNAVIWVRVPSIQSGGASVYIYIGAPPGTSSASTIATFTEPGLKFHTRNSTANPGNRSAAESAFDTAGTSAPGYGCAIIPDYTNVNNRGLFAPPNRNSDIGLYAEAFFEVSPAQAGVWQFRYGGDFGRGGGLYVDDVPLEEDWNTDLWWAFNWNNASEILQGSINLSAGIHSVRILGFEGCCDGGLTAQFQPPGGSWQAVSLANLSVASRKCPITTEPQATFGSVEPASCPTLTVTRSNQVLSDPLNILTNPKAIPGSVVVNQVDIVNTGAGQADTDSLFVTDVISPGTALRVVDYDGSTAGPVRFADGSTASGMTYSFLGLSSVTDDVSFSNDNGASWTYAPIADANGTDTAVTNIRINPKGTFLASGGSGDPAASFYFKVIVQ